ncbi:MAG: hypothetical protein EOL97_09000 [Spirochaetia bacterium]|nr:hypothetical protein [Spirochaetia bacterium]
MKGIPLSKENIQQIITLINQKHDYNYICDMLHVSKSVISGIVKKYNLQYTLKSTKSVYYNKILDLAKQGYKPIEIHKITNAPKGTIASILNQNNFRYLPKHNNIRYFQIIDTHEKAYLLGFIAADGCIQSNGNSSYGLSITLHSKDRIILEILKKELDSTCNIQHITTKMSNSDRKKDHVRLAIFNIDLYNDILQYGITPKKSLTMANIIPNIPKEFRKSFMLGYFDGDGCVLHSNQIRIKNGKQYPSRGLVIQIRGTKEFLQGMADELELTNYAIYFDKTHSLRFSKKIEIIKMFKCYYDCNIFLARKRDIFLQYMSHSSWNKFIQVQTISLPVIYNL